MAQGMRTLVLVLDGKLGIGRAGVTILPFQFSQKLGVPAGKMAGISYQSVCVCVNEAPNSPNG
jgi:hypothetical protein